MPPQKFAGGIGAINFKSLGLCMVMVDKPEIMEQRRDVEQLGIEFQILPMSLDRAEHKDADRVVEQHVVFVLAHQLGGLPCHLAVGNLHAGNCDGHFKLLP